VEDLGCFPSIFSWVFRLIFFHERECLLQSSSEVPSVSSIWSVRLCWLGMVGAPEIQQLCYKFCLVDRRQVRCTRTFFAHILPLLPGLRSLWLLEQFPQGS
jgi:hypothetical protein